MILKGPIARGTIRTSAVLGLRLVVQAGTLLLVARLLGPQDFGAFAGVAALAVTLGTLSTFGMHLVLLAALSRGLGSRDELLARTLPVTLSCGGMLLAVFLLVCTTLLGDLAVPLTVLLAIGVAETLIQPLLALPTWEMTARGEPARSQLLAVFPLALRLISVIGVLWMAPEEPLMLFGYAYLCASAAALAVVSAGRLSPWLPPRRWRWPERAQWREAAGYALLNVTAMGSAELDKTLAVRLLPATDAGLYAAAQRVVGAVTLPVSAMLLSALPRLFREGSERSARTPSLLVWIFIVAAAYGLVLATALWFVAPMIAGLFGVAYQGILETIRWLCLAVPAMTLRIATANILMTMGKAWMRVTIEVIGLLALLAAAIFLTVWLGAPGMPIALACVEWGMVLAGIWMLLATVSRKGGGCGLEAETR